MGGGEEFILMLPNTKLEGAKIIAEKVREAIHDKVIHYKNNEISVTVTLCIVLFDEMQPINDCIKKADKALYEGKRRGKNCVVEFG